MVGLKPLVEISNRGLENRGYVVKAAGGNPVLAALVFLKLLIRDA